MSARIQINVKITVLDIISTVDQVMFTAINVCVSANQSITLAILFEILGVSK